MSGLKFQSSQLCTKHANIKQWTEIYGFHEFFTKKAEGSEEGLSGEKTRKKGSENTVCNSASVHTHLDSIQCSCCDERDSRA